jgi:hypothetical protein
MVYCGAIKRGFLEDLRDLETLLDLVKKNIDKEGLSLLLPKNMPKVRQYGIN